MTDTAKLADVVLPATMFLEHDDIYRGGGNQHIMLGPKLIEPPEGPRTNHFVIEELAQAPRRRRPAGLRHDRARAHRRHAGASAGSAASTRFKRAALGRPAAGFRDRAFPQRLRPSRRQVPLPAGLDRHRPRRTGRRKAWACSGRVAALPEFPDHVDLIEVADAEHPFRLATSPARNFLNSTFAETPASRQKEGRPELLIHPDDAAALGIADGDRVEIGNRARRGRAARKTVRRRASAASSSPRASGRTTRMSAARASTC